MKYFIFTGASRGIGEAMSKKLLRKDHHVICISRQQNTTLTSMANTENILLDYFEFDLNEVQKIDDLMKDIIGKIDDLKVESISLINNAAVVTPVEYIDQSEPDDMIQQINVNLTAPMLLTSSFIKYTKQFNVDKRVLNISSGLSFNLKPQLSCYSTSKAALETFTKSIGVEQTEVQIMAVRPGAVDTEMYEESMKSDENAMNVKLASPNYAADRMLTFLFDRFEHGKVVKGW